MPKEFTVAAPRQDQARRGKAVRPSRDPSTMLRVVLSLSKDEAREARGGARLRWSRRLRATSYGEVSP